MNDFSKLFSQFVSRKRWAVESAIADIWRRNNLPANEIGYLLKTEEHPFPDGGGRTEIRLYKLIDASTVTLEPQMEVVQKDGVGKLLEFSEDPTHPYFYDPKSGKTDDATPEEKVGNGEQVATNEDDW